MPTKAGYAFTPTSRTYTNVTSNPPSQNYAGTAGHLLPLRKSENQRSQSIFPAAA